MIGSLLLAVVTCSTEPKTVGDLFKTGETVAWVFESDGERVGYHTSRYIGVDELAGVKAHHFQGAFRLKDEVVVLATGELWTDDHGHPVRFVQQGLVGDSYSRVELDVAGAKSKARIQQGLSTREVTLDVDPKAYLLANNFISHLEIVLALEAENETRAVDETRKLKLFSGNTLQALGYTLKLKGTYVADYENSAEHGSTYQDSLGEELTFGFIMRMSNSAVTPILRKVEIKPAKLVIERSTESFEAITITPPVRKVATDLDIEEVKIRHDDVEIAGAVTKKKGASGRLPAVFFISGSGPQDRDGFSSGIDLGTHEILDRLTREGFLVLRVDDRGAGATKAPETELSFTDLLADARACINFLAKREDVDPKRIILIGHSEGGVTAPILAAERPEIAAIVLMAAPGRPLIEVIMDQNRRELRKQGLKKAELEAELSKARAFLTRVMSDEPIDPASLTSDDERETLASRKWLQSHAKQDPVANIVKVKCPVLLLQGEKDFQVSESKDALALSSALDKAGHPDSQLHVFETLDHLFKESPKSKSDIADYYTDRRVDEKFLEELTAWLAERFAK